MCGEELRQDRKGDSCEVVISVTSRGADIQSVTEKLFVEPCRDCQYYPRGCRAGTSVLEVVVGASSSCHATSSFLAGEVHREGWGGGEGGAVIRTYGGAGPRHAGGKLVARGAGEGGRGVLEAAEVVVEVRWRGGGGRHGRRHEGRERGRVLDDRPAEPATSIPRAVRESVGLAC